MARTLMKIVVLFTAVAIGAILILSIKAKLQEKEFNLSRIKGLPDFVYMTMDSLAYNNQMLPRKKYSIFIFFSPDCDHCQYQAISLKKELPKLEEAYIVWVAAESNVSIVRRFSKKYGIENIPNCIVLADTYNQIYKAFRIDKLPSILVYGKDKMLVNQFIGETNWESIEKILN